LGFTDSQVYPGWGFGVDATQTESARQCSQPVLVYRPGAWLVSEGALYLVGHLSLLLDNDIRKEARAEAAIRYPVRRPYSWAVRLGDRGDVAAKQVRGYLGAGGCGRWGSSDGRETTAASGASR